MNGLNKIKARGIPCAFMLNEGLIFESYSGILVGILIHNNTS